MRRAGGMMRLSTRGVTRTAAITAVMAVTGVVAAGSAPANGQQVVKPRLDYTCTFSSGLRETGMQAGVQVAATFPEAGTVGQPIEATGTGLTMTLPHTAIASLAKLHAVTIAAAARLNTKVAENGASASNPWSALTTAVTPVPAAGTLVLSASGAVPPVTVHAPGQVTFTATDLSVLLTPRTASGSATSPPNLLLDCNLDSGQQATLATVPVAMPASGPAPRQPGVSGHGAPISIGHVRNAGKANCPPYPKNGYALNKHFKLPSYPPGSTIIYPTPQQACAYIEGFADVSKLGEAALIGPGLSNLSNGLRVVEKMYTHPTSVYLQDNTAGQLYYKPCATCKAINGLPPAHATFLTFGFMPTTATLQITEVGTLNIAAVALHTELTYTRIWSLVSIRVSNVLVNGVPLNVGSDCHTQTPFKLVLTGKPPYELQLGGVIAGTATIPPFTGCGVGENLDQIFTASVSGPGNYTQLTQGNLCTPPPNLYNCPAKPPKKVVH